MISLLVKEMRLLVYNIRYGAGTGKRFHLPFPFSGYLKRTTKNFGKITEFLRSCEPDIVGLIEADSGSFRSEQTSQVAAAALELGHFHVFETKYGSRSVLQKLPIVKKQCNAFLTSEKIKTHKFHYFKMGIKRLVIELELEDVTIFLVHLSIKFRQRHNQMGDLYNLVKNVKKPVIVAGDFNPLWGDHEMQLFLAATGLHNANGGGRPSYPSWAPRRQIDFILHSPDVRITNFEVMQVPFSDHLPLLCDFEVQKNGSSR